MVRAANAWSKRDLAIAAAAVALVDPLVQNVVASIIILSVAFLWARWLNRFLREILA